MALLMKMKIKLKTLFLQFANCDKFFIKFIENFFHFFTINFEVLLIFK